LNSAALALGQPQRHRPHAHDGGLLWQVSATTARVANIVCAAVTTIVRIGSLSGAGRKHRR
jgi:hypothetical protein